MDRETEDLWAFTAKQRNPRSESIAVRRCQEGETIPLMSVLVEYGLPQDLIIDICLTIKNRSKPKKIGPVFLVGSELEKRLRARPGEKKQIEAELSAEYRQRGRKLTPKTAQNYHRKYLRQMKKRGWTRADLDEIRARCRTAPAPTEAELQELDEIVARHRPTGKHRPGGRGTRVTATDPTVH